MSKTGGGRRTNQHKIRGRSVVTPGRGTSEPEVSLGSVHDVNYGETPLDVDAYEFLTPACQGLTTLAQLNEAELTNTLDAEDWLDEQDWSLSDLLNQTSLREIHRRMFGDVWTWAGKLRIRQTNLGVSPDQVPEQWEQLIGNTRWQAENHAVDATELGVRFHRGMLNIHCFTNGNGRHARLVANKMGEIFGLGEKLYTWGQRSGDDVETKRREYIHALRVADETGDYDALVKVALS